MANSIRTNLMAGNAARTLGSHYNRLSKSVQRLSSGLRINSAADDAAGLAIRELMRADVSTLNQGIRNANDAISMIQTADGALAVIDEKLIRMKELAEQAATGTYNSTQRLIISSEYQAMAAEIDRIANATDFNGIKLLDGSLSGTHNGRGLNSTGAMKIHFGTGNASAEDYYYITIGDCTIKGLGLVNYAGPSGSQGTYVKKEQIVYEQQTYNPPTSATIYTDPVTGNEYYNNGEYYYSDWNNPATSTLDWQTDGDIIARLRTEQETTKTSRLFMCYLDPVTNTEYFKSQLGNRYYLDPNDESTRLDSYDNKEIINRLVYTNRMVRIETVWLNYENEDGRKYYSRDGGVTYVTKLNSPDNIVLDSNRPGDKDAIAALKPIMKAREMVLPFVRNEYLEYRDPVGQRLYFSYDNGQTFCSSYSFPDKTKLDPVNDKALIDRLVPNPEQDTTHITYDIWRYLDGNKWIHFYTTDGGQTFIPNTSKPGENVLTRGDPADDVTIAKLTPDYRTTTGGVVYDVYEDTVNGNKKYYSSDGGKSFCEDYRDPANSMLDSNDPGYAALIARFVKTTSTEQPMLTYYRYSDPSRPNVYYYSSDGGNTFVESMGSTDVIVLNKADPADQAKIAALQKDILEQSVYTFYDVYYDPADNNKKYYAPRYQKDKFILDINNPQNIALDSSIPADKNVIDRLVVHQTSGFTFDRPSLPDIFYIYEDSQSGTIYYTHDNGQSFTTNPNNPYGDSSKLDPADPADKAILDRLRPHMASLKKTVYVMEEADGGAGGYTISTQELAQRALVDIDNAIVSKDKIRAHLGALQNRLENTVTNLSIQAENLQASESRISDTDVATEMTAFVRNQILTESATAMLSQANSFPHMLMNLLQG